MLSYRHGFHAGNYADVLKHITEILLLKSMLRKDKPFCYIDTHAGAGAYSLKSDWSNKTGEYLNGIAKVFHNEKLHKLVPEYFELLKKINDGKDELVNYPGSPYIACAMMRPQDEQICLELHPNEYENLKYNMYHFKNCHVHHRDALEGINAVLPPPIRRGIVFIDPSFEEDADYRNTIKMIKNIHKKFNQAVIALWYPVLGKGADRSYELTRELTKLQIPGTIKTELQICGQDTLLGMHATGMIVMNYPFEFDRNIAEILTILTTKLALDPSASYKIETLVLAA